MSARNSSEGLKVDLYELTMAAGYFQNKVDTRATFELSCHTMPANRSYLLACGLEQVVEYILDLHFTDEDIAFLKSLPVFKHVRNDFFDYLRHFKFHGNVWAMPEGEIFFAREPILQVEAPIIEAQILETYVLSLMNIESAVATKAARIVTAARSDGLARGVIDFGSRRAHGPQAGVLAALGGGKRVVVLNAGAFELVQIEVEDGDLHHIGVVVEAGKGVALQELPLLWPELAAVKDSAGQVRRLGVLPQDVVVGGDEEAGRAASRVADAQAGLGSHERNDQVDDMARRAELTVGAGLRELAEQILIHVAFEIVTFVGREVHFCDALHDGAQRGAVVDLQRGVAE